MWPHLQSHPTPALSKYPVHAPGHQGAPPPPPCPSQRTEKKGVAQRNGPLEHRVGANGNVKQRVCLRPQLAQQPHQGLISTDSVTPHVAAIVAATLTPAPPSATRHRPLPPKGPTTTLAHCRHVATPPANSAHTNAAAVAAVAQRQRGRSKKDHRGTCCRAAPPRLVCQLGVPPGGRRAALEQEKSVRSQRTDYQTASDWQTDASPPRAAPPQTVGTLHP